MLLDTILLMGSLARNFTMKSLLKILATPPPPGGHIVSPFFAGGL
jgi:hypothetical protein